MLEREVLEKLFIEDRDAFDLYMESLTQLTKAKERNSDLVAQEKTYRENDLDEVTKEQITRYPAQLQTEVIAACLAELNRLNKAVKYTEEKKELASIRNNFFHGMCLALDYYSKGTKDPSADVNEIYTYEDYLKDTIDVRGDLVTFCIKRKEPTHLLTTLEAYKMTQEAMARQKTSDATEAEEAKAI